MQTSSNLQSKRTGLEPPKAPIDAKDISVTKPEVESAKLPAESKTLLEKTAVTDEAASDQKTNATVDKVVEETSRLSLDKKDENIDKTVEPEQLQKEVTETTEVKEAKEVPAVEQSSLAETNEPQVDSVEKPIDCEKTQPAQTEPKVVEASTSEIPKEKADDSVATGKKRTIDEISGADKKDENTTEPPYSRADSKKLPSEMSKPEDPTPSKKKKKVEEEIDQNPKPSEKIDP